MSVKPGPKPKEDGAPPAPPEEAEAVGADGDRIEAGVQGKAQRPPGRPKRTELTREQRRAIVELLVNDDLTRVGAAVGRSPRTIERWLELPYFRSELDRQLEGVLGMRSSQASAMVDELCTRLLELARCDDLPIALGAVKFGLERADKIFDRWHRMKESVALPPALQEFLDELQKGEQP